MHASEQIGGRCVGHDVPRSCQADEVSPLSAVAFRGAGMRGPQRRARLGNKDSSASRVGRHLSGFLLRSQSLDGEVAHPTKVSCLTTCFDVKHLPRSGERTGRQPVGAASAPCGFGTIVMCASVSFFLLLVTVAHMNGGH
jgi:hypothetical protein